MAGTPICWPGQQANKAQKVERRMKKRKWKINDTFLELLFGIMLVGIFGTLMIMLLIHDKGYSAGGFVAGVVISVMMLTHMYFELEKALYMGEAGALKHTRMTSGLRMVVVTAVMMVLAYSGIVNIFALLTGAMSLKVSAYIQPFTHKFLIKFLQKG